MIKNKTAYLIATAFFCTLFFMPNVCFAKELCLTYNVKTKQVIEAKEGKKEEKNSESQIIVGLGNDYFYVSNNGSKRVFDFQRKRIIDIDNTNKVYRDISLFSDIGFRYMEFQNRIFLRDVLNAAAVKSKANIPEQEGMFDIESLFAIVKSGSPEPLIIENKQGDNHEYSFNNQIVVECKLSNNLLSDTQGWIFDKYLIYQCCLHPQIRKKIISKKQIPQYLKYIYKETGRMVSVEMDLVKSVFEENDTYAVPADYTKLYEVSSKELAIIISNVMLGKSQIKRLEKPDFYKIADDLRAKGSYFDAVLVILEYGLQTGDNSADKMREILSAQNNSDPRLKVFLQIQSPKDKEAAQAVSKAYESINRAGLNHGYVIDIMLADNEMLLGNSAKAQELFIKVLNKNPYLIGVYKDLGDVFNTSYETPSAWQCWDTARFLYPDHKMLQQANEYEKWLANNFPDFFLSN